MQYKSELQQGTLIKRYKRFLADVLLTNGEQITIHCPNTGAMTGCAEPNFQVYFSTSDSKTRKYPHTFELAQNTFNHFIAVNTQLANHLAVEAIQNSKVNELNGYDQLETEVKYGEEKSRIDIKLSSGHKEDCYIEVKSCTLLLDENTGLGAFPDAVTTRGQKHLRELAAMRQLGKRAVLLFLVQHTGIKQVTVAEHIDPKYAEELKKALSLGVEILVLHTHIDADNIFVTHTSEFVL